MNTPNIPLKMRTVRPRLSTSLKEVEVDLCDDAVLVALVLVAVRVVLDELGVKVPFDIDGILPIMSFAVEPFAGTKKR